MDKLEKIWLVVQAVPYGRVASYGQIADLAGLPGRARLAGKALKIAPKSYRLPWHRIIRSNGEFGLRNNSELIQQQTDLLLAENIVVINDRVKIKHFLWQPNLSELLQLPE